MSSQEVLRGLPPWLILLGALAATAPLSIDMYLPALPTIADTLQADAGAVQRTLATFFIGLALGQMIYGPLSDRFGRKPPLYIGFTLYAVASLGCALADSAAALQLWRFIQALGGCAGIVIARAVIRDRCDARTSAKAYSLIMLVSGLAPILAPLLGGVVLQWLGWRAIFAVLAIFGALILLAVHFAMEETHDRHTATPLRIGNIVKGYGELLRDRHFIGFALCGGMATAGMFAYIAGSPFVLIDLYGIPAQHFGWIFGANAFGLIAASQINGRLLGRHDPNDLLRRAVWTPALVGVALVLLYAMGQSGLMILLPGLFGFIASLGFISPNSAALAMQHQGARAGMASALLGTVQFVFAMLASSAISAVHNRTEWPLIMAMAVCGAATWLIYQMVKIKAENTQP